jgi:hypothetical protein
MKPTDRNNPSITLFQRRYPDDIPHTHIKNTDTETESKFTVVTLVISKMEYIIVKAIIM